MLPGVHPRAVSSPGNSHSRGFQLLLAIPDAPPACFVHRTRQSSVPPDAAMGSPSQVQCCTLPEHGPGVQRLFRFQKGKPPLLWGLSFLESGSDLLSRAVSSQVPSALKGLTSVFGMGTGGSLSPLSPEFCQGLVQSIVLLASAASIVNHSLRLGNAPHISRVSFLLRVP